LEAIGFAAGPLLARPRPTALSHLGGAVGRVRYEVAEDVCEAIRVILGAGVFPHVDPERVRCVRSWGSRGRAVARIYGLPRPWIVAGLEPGYVIEVVSEAFDVLPCREKVRVLVHELAHIPSTFSGALRPHRRGFGAIVRGAMARLPREALEAACGVLRGYYRGGPH